MKVNSSIVWKYSTNHSLGTFMNLRNFRKVKVLA